MDPAGKLHFLAADGDNLQFTTELFDSRIFSEIMNSLICCLELVDQTLNRIIE